MSKSDQLDELRFAVGSFHFSVEPHAEFNGSVYDYISLLEFVLDSLPGVSEVRTFIPPDFDFDVEGEVPAPGDVAQQWGFAPYFHYLHVEYELTIPDDVQWELLDSHFWWVTRGASRLSVVTDYRGVPVTVVRQLDPEGNMMPSDSLKVCVRA